MCFTISPLRLWTIEYEVEKKQYCFIALNGEKTIIDGDKVPLWEKATGKKTIHEIHKESHSLSIDYVLDFYKDLEEKMALVFVDF